MSFLAPAGDLFATLPGRGNYFQGTVAPRRRPPPKPQEHDMPAAAPKIITSAALLAALTACTQISMPDSTDGAAFFAQNCVSCHGTSGTGDGPLAAGLAQAPADLTTLSQRNGGTFPTAQALSYIYGDPDRGHLARVMPQFGSQMASDLVPLEVNGVLTPTPRVLAGLFAYLESIQQQP